MLTITPLPFRCHGGRSLARFSAYEYDPVLFPNHTYYKDKYFTQPAAPEHLKEYLLPPPTGRFSRLFALRGKVAGLLAPGEHTAAHTTTDGTLVTDPDSAVPEYATRADTSTLVRFDFADPLPQLQPTETVIILGRRYIVARLEYTLYPARAPRLTAYFYPAN